MAALGPNVRGCNQTVEKCFVVYKHKACIQVDSRTNVCVKMWSTLGAVRVWFVSLIDRTCVTFNPQLEKNELLFSSSPLRRTVGKLENIIP